jgi:hypothetical protein
MGIYAALGVAQAISAFMMGATLALLNYFASQRLHKEAIKRVMHAPMSFFETTVCNIQSMVFQSLSLTTIGPPLATPSYYESIL